MPFRGEYFELKPAYEHLVTGLIYPVPDPTLPFLGVHLTKMINGGVHAGPNAVLALAREGYSWGTIAPRDVADYLRWPGLWRLGRRFWKTGIGEVRRSLSHRRFLASLRELVPALPDDSLEPAPAGVRAQALRRDGTMVDDFAYVRAPAPDPRAERSLAGGHRVPGDRSGHRRRGRTGLARVFVAGAPARLAARIQGAAILVRGWKLAARSGLGARNCRPWMEIAGRSGLGCRQLPSVDGNCRPQAEGDDA